MLKLNIVEKKEDITNEWTVERISKERAPSGWKKVFEDSVYELEDVSEILEEDKKNHGQWYPYNQNLFRAFEMCPLSKVKVVIIGQDPYHNTYKPNLPQAVGMSFSVPRGCPVPSSLKNIYKEISNTVPEFVMPKHGDLTGWAVQGVLLLNACLTVRPNSPGSHKQIWMGLVKKVITAILDTNKNAIFVLWGNNAKKLTKFLGQRATILEAAHPSGLSAHRGFFGCNHFVEINKILEETGQKQIDWNLP